MPFSFIDIEEKKTRVIGLLFVFIILFYFLTAYLITLIFVNAVFPSAHVLRHTAFRWPNFGETFVALGFAFSVGLFHWMSSVSNLINKISVAIGAVALDTGDVYHQNLKNIMDELSVAVGGRPIEGMVIPTASCNAFALEDVNGRCIIGVTEGLLSTLSRAQLEAVVAHEAGHIVSGDCVNTTLICALAEIYEEIFLRLKAVLRGSRGRGSALVFLLFLAIGLMRFLSSLIRYFISREREYRADAVSVRLTRDPLSLAEALMLISTRWRGEGAQGEKMQSIFIVNPAYSPLDEMQGLWSDMFSTHPPVKRRIDILVNMAHMDIRTLEENLKNFRWVSPVAQGEFKTKEAAGDKKWFVFLDQKWQGPYGLGELQRPGFLTPEAWVRLEGADQVRHAYEDKDILSIFSAQVPGAEGHMVCPHCRTALGGVSYEGVPVSKCSYCEGVFIEDEKISRILIRGDMRFSQEAVRLANVVINEREKFAAGLVKKKMTNIWVLTCPKCGNRMRRQFFVYSYPVEIDRCVGCAGIWFDRLKLEVLQYIYEHKEQYFDGKNF